MLNQCKVLIFIAFVLISMGLIQNAYAHPGRTASDGCHYCRTNCAKWGEIQGARHCHGGGSAAPAPSYQPTTYTAPAVPSCPSNAYYNSSTNSCTCSSGYTPSLDESFCVKIPANAHAVTSKTDVWECNYGYEEKNSTCVLIPKKEPPKTPINTTTKTNSTTTINANKKTEGEVMGSNSDNTDGGSGIFYGLLTLLGGAYYGYKKFKGPRVTQ